MFGAERVFSYCMLIRKKDVDLRLELLELSMAKSRNKESSSFLLFNNGGMGNRVNREREMNENTFSRKFGELVKELGTLPASQRKRLELLAQETKQRHAELKKSVSSLQDALDYLRLAIKYLLFDLEATRRENRTLRDLLGRPDDDEGRGKGRKR